MPRLSTTWLFIIALLSIVLTSTAQVNYFYTLTWDPTTHSTQPLLASAINAEILKCDVASRPLFSRLQAGTEINAPRLWVRLQNVSTFESSACFTALTAAFTFVDTTAQNLTSIGNCYIEGRGFATGLQECPAIAGSACSVSAATPTVCGGGLKCDTDGLCTVDPQIYRFTVNYDAAPSNADAAATVKDINTQFTGLLAGDCSAVKAFQVVSTATSSSTPLDEAKFYVYASIDLNAFPNACKTAAQALVPVAAGSIFTSVTFSDTRLTNVNRGCYTLDSNGYLATFDLSSLKCNTLTVPIGGICTSNNVCPGTSSACGKLPTGDQVCLKYLIDEVVANRQMGTLTFTAGAILASAPFIREHYNVKTRLEACTLDSATWLGSVSSTVIAVSDDTSKWVLTFYLQSADPIPQACIDALQDRSDLPAIASIVYAPLTAAEIPSFSCITVSTTASSTLELAGFVCGGRCAWNCALGEACTIHDDCDSAGGIQCRSPSNVCTKPGLVPSDSTVTISRIDITADAYLGNSYGTQRLELFKEKLKSLCPQWTASTLVIGNANYSKVNMWLYPFDYTLCTQQLVQSAAQQASNTAISANEVDLLTGEILHQPSASILGFDVNDLIEEEVSNEQEHIIDILQEGEEEPTPPATPSVVIPRLRYASIKTFRVVAKPDCVDGESVKCLAEVATCDIPCAFGATCIVDAQCGSFGKCNNGVCAQKGTSFVKPSSAAAISVTFLLLCLFSLLLL